MLVYTPRMHPITIAAILSSAKVAKAIRDFAGDETKNLAKDSVGTGLKVLIHRLQPGAREKAPKKQSRTLQMLGTASWKTRRR